MPFETKDHVISRRLRIKHQNLHQARPLIRGAGKRSLADVNKREPIDLIRRAGFPIKFGVL
jgi:hypothetical protein